jgi:ABC-type sugar transport system permease subunit
LISLCNWDSADASAPKKFSRNNPDWLIGSPFFVSLLAIAVLPIEIAALLADQDFSRPDLWVWLGRSLYIFGYGMALAIISPWTEPSFMSGPLRLVVVLLGLLISAPAYFVVGALLATRKAIAKALGVILFIPIIIVSCYATLVILISD